MTTHYRFKMRRGLASAWTAGNEVLLQGEIGIELDTNLFKFGDGVTPWNDLDYVSGSGGGGGDGSINVSAGTTSVEASAFTFANSNGVSFGLNGQTITGSVRTDYQSSGAYLTTAMQSNAATISNAKVSAGTLSALRSDLTFGDSNGVSFGLNTNGVLTGTVATNYQSQGAYLTTAALSQDSSKYAGTNGAITGGSITVNTSGVSINLPAYLTTAQPVGAYLTTARASNDAIGLNTAQSNVTWTANSSGLSLDARGYAGTGTSATNASVTLNSNGLAISVGSQSAQTQNVHNVTLSGNTAGVMAQVSSGTLTFAGGNNITLSQDGNAITISGANVGGAQTGISGLAAAGGTITSGTASFSNASGVSFGVNGQTITASVRTDYQSSGAYLTTAMQSDAVTLSNVKFSGGTLSALRSDITFGDSNGVSFGLETNGVLTATVATNYQSIGAYLTTAALSQDSSKYAGTNGAITGGSITVNTSGVSINLPAYLTTADLSQNSSKYVQEWALTGNTAGTTSSAQGSRLYLSGGQGITISGSSNSLVFSVGSYITTGALSQDSSKYAGTNGAITGGSLTVNTSGVSINLPAYLTTAALSQDSSKYAGTNGAITGGSITVNTSGVSINLPAYLTTADLSQNSSKYIQEWALTGNTAGTTSSAQGTRLYLSGGQGITLSGSSNSLVFSIGSYITTGALSGDTSKYAFTGFTTTTIAGSVVAGTHNTDGLKLAVPGYLTTAGLSADSSKYAATGFTTTSVAGVVIAGTHNTDGLKLAVPGYLTTAMLSNAVTLSNIKLSAGSLSALRSDLTFADSNGVTFGLETNGVVTASVGAGLGGGGITLSAGATSQSFGNLVLSDSNRVSFGLNGSTVTAKHALNFSAGTTSNEISDQIVFSNSNGYSFGLNGSTVTAKGPFAGWMEPNPMTNTALFGPGAGSWYLAPFTAFNSASGGRINFLMQNTSTAQLFRDFTEASIRSDSTGAQQQGYTYSLAAAIFSQGTGTNSTRLESAWSNSFSFGWSKSVSVNTANAGLTLAVTVAHSLSYIGDIGTDGAYTLSSYANSTASTNIGANSAATNFFDTVFSSGRNLVSGSVVYPIGLNTTLSAGAYWLGFAWSSTRSNASTGTRISTALDFSQSSIVGISRLEMNSLYRGWGSTATTARSAQIPYGLYTAAANMTPPAAIAFSSDLSSIASQWVPYFNIQFRGLTK